MLFPHQRARTRQPPLLLARILYPCTSIYCIKWTVCLCILCIPHYDVMVDWYTGQGKKGVCVGKNVNYSPWLDNRLAKKCAHPTHTFTHPSHTLTHLPYTISHPQHTHTHTLKLIGGLANEKVRWAESVAPFNSMLVNMVGGMMVSAGVVAYTLDHLLWVRAAELLQPRNRPYFR